MSVAIWITGLSGSGKTTIAMQLSSQLSGRGIRNEVIDGDEYRAILSPRAGYTEAERDEFRRKVIFFAEILTRNDVVCILPLLSSSRTVRAEARSSFKHFVEVYLECPLAVCEERDPKGHYRRVRNGELDNFVGIHIPYEEPGNPEITIDTSLIDVTAAADRILDHLRHNYPEIFHATHTES